MSDRPAGSSFYCITCVGSYMACTELPAVQQCFICLQRNVPLPPANDTREALIELRAAEIAANVGKIVMTSAEFSGWRSWSGEATSDGLYQLLDGSGYGDGYLAGWLAAEIYWTGDA